MSNLYSLDFARLRCAGKDFAIKKYLLTIEKALHWTHFPEHGFLLYPDPPRDFVEACGQNRRPAVTVVFPDKTSQQAILWLGQAHLIRIDGWRGWIDTGYLVGISPEMEQCLEGAEIWWNERD